MKPSTHSLNTTKTGQQGVETVEFAFAFTILIVLLLGIFEFGRLLFTWNSAVEATRRGARLAIVCNKDVIAIKNQVQAILPNVAAADISITYSPSGCTGAADCQSVSVEISPNAPAFQYFIPFLAPSPSPGVNPFFQWGYSRSFHIPPFSTTLTRESLANGSGLDQNPDC